MEFKKILQSAPEFRYMILDRMKHDCLYYLGNDGMSRHPKHLWAGEEKLHIQYMKELWNSFAPDEKPEYLTYEEILDYEKNMCERTSLEEKIHAAEASKEKNINKITPKDTYLENKKSDKEMDY